MRIGMIGAGGTGKTTTAELLAKDMGLPAIPSTTRAVFSKYGKVQTDMNNMEPDLRWKIQRDNFLTRKAMDDAIPEGIFDRTLLDHLMYCLIYCYPSINDLTMRDMKDQVLESLHTYDLLLFFPIYNWAEPVDGFRDSTYANRTLQDLILRGYLNENYVGTQYVPNIGPDSRVELIKTKLRELQK